MSIEERLIDRDTAAAGLIRLHLRLKGVHINGHAFLLCKEPRQIHREAITIVQHKGVLTANDLGVLLGRLEVLEANLPCLGEGFFLVVEDGLHASDGLRVLEVGEESPRD